MAGGIDWFRWHHGSVNDQKFGLVARKAGASVAEVIATWACLLELASAAAERGDPGVPDFESIDFALGMDDGKSQRIYERMQERGLIDPESGRIASWEKRQPKRERTDDNSTDRVRAFRERKRHETPSNAAKQQRNGDGTTGLEVPQETPETEGVAEHGSDDCVDVGGSGTSSQVFDHYTDFEDGEKSNAMKRQATPRGEERRGEEKKKHSSGKPDLPPGFKRFWSTWPNTDRKVAKAECVKRWKAKGLEEEADEIVAHVEAMKRSKQWKDGYEPAPLTFLNQRRWEDGEGCEGSTQGGNWWLAKGYGDEELARRDGHLPPDRRAA